MFTGEGMGGNLTMTTMDIHKREIVSMFSRGKGKVYGIKGLKYTSGIRQVEHEGSRTF